MKIRHILASTLLAGFAALGLAAGLKEAPARRASAEPEPPAPTYFYMVGSMNSWVNTNTDYPIQSNDMYGTAKLVHTFAKGDAFKVVRTPGSWDNELNYSCVVGNGALKASPCFVKGDGESTNIVCDVAGTYWLRLAQSASGYYLFIDEENNFTDFEIAEVCVQLKDWTTTKIYVYDEDTYVNKLEIYGSYGGMDATQFYGAVDGINFNGSLGGIAKVMISYTKGYPNNTKLILNNNGATGAGNQSGNQIAVDGYYYWNNGNEGNADYGAAAGVVFDIGRTIKYAGGQSLCNLTKSEAQTLLNEYGSLNEDAKSYVDASTFYTWEAKDSANKKNFTGAEVIAQLTVIANKPEPSPFSVGYGEQTTAISMIIVVAAVTLVAIVAGSILILRRRKEN